jgi:hypothetical protein
MPPGVAADDARKRDCVFPGNVRPVRPCANNASGSAVMVRGGEGGHYRDVRYILFRDCRCAEHNRQRWVKYRVKMNWAERETGSFCPGRRGCCAARATISICRPHRCSNCLRRRRNRACAMPPTQLRQKKVVFLAGLGFVKVSANHRLLPQFGFSSSASSLTLPVPVIVRKWLWRLPRPTAIPKS